MAAYDENCYSINSFFAGSFLFSAIIAVAKRIQLLLMSKLHKSITLKSYKK